MEKVKKIKYIIMIVWICLLNIPITAYAHDVPDFDRSGNITITMKYGNEVVSGGSLTMYRVGDVVESDGDYHFVPCGSFSKIGQSFGDITSKELALNLSKIAKDEMGKTMNIDSAGNVQFSDLKIGLYLFVQNQASNGYESCSPFLVSLPYMENETYIYDIHVSSKTELKKTTSVIDKKDPILPNTGILYWPIPVLVVGGLGLFVLGWRIYSK